MLDLAKAKGDGTGTTTTAVDDGDAELDVVEDAPALEESGGALTDGDVGLGEASGAPMNPGFEGCETEELDALDGMLVVDSHSSSLVEVEEAVGAATEAGLEGTAAKPEL